MPSEGTQQVVPVREVAVQRVRPTSAAVAISPSEAAGATASTVAAASRIAVLVRSLVPVSTAASLVMPDRPPGGLVTRVTSDTVLLREAASSSLVNLVNGSVSLVGTIVLMAVLDVPLLLCTLAALVVIAVLVGLLMPPIARAQEQAQPSLGNLGGILEGGLRAVRTVKSSGRNSARATG
ncbi:ABC transporter transmembrane domain-containing protein [Embleya sp. NPDC059259]|uniref:ABC transporter transmembrane domain-containing protein n=1 Tax=unclassified Embleya TaxID=2699296 RepID=UPI0036BB9448